MVSIYTHKQNLTAQLIVSLPGLPQLSVMNKLKRKTAP